MFLIILAFLFASLASLILLTIRFTYSGQLMYAFLIWNLFLAWIPFIFSLLAYKVQKRPFFFIITTFFWLLFFPNALYLVTDFIHLRPIGIVPVWYDAAMLFSFALTGLLLGFISLHFMQRIISQWFGQSTGWLFAIMVLGLSSFGVYIGRFLRWNSWDVLLRPMILLADIFSSLINPNLLLKSFVVSLLFTILFTFAYVGLFWLSAIGYQLFAAEGQLTAEG